MGRCRFLLSAVVLVTSLVAGCTSETDLSLLTGLIEGDLPPYIVHGQFEPYTFEELLSPGLLGVDYEELVLTNRQGQSVHAWFMPVENPAGTVLIHHGAVTNRSAAFGNYLFIRRFGYNVMVYDYQGFGENPNPAALKTVMADADAALAWLQGSKRPGTDRIVLYGVSLGTLPTIAQAARQPEKVVGIILEGSFTADSLPSWAYLLMGILPWAVDVEAAYPELDSKTNITHVTVPILFIQSRDDTITPFAGAEQLYGLAHEPKQFVEVYGEHTTSWISDLRYAKILRDYLGGLP
jgi:uncharacterized protein